MRHWNNGDLGPQAEVDPHQGVKNKIEIED
jgi:hypothetical protein